MNLIDKLKHAATEFDRKQSTRRGWNPYALGQYFEAIDKIAARIEAGEDARAAIEAETTPSTFRTALLRAV